MGVRSIVKLINEIKEVNENIKELEIQKNNLIKKFFSSFPIADMYEAIPTVKYLGEEYDVTDFDFEKLVVALETEPFSKNNKFVTVSIEDYIELYKDSYQEYKLNQ